MSLIELRGNIFSEVGKIEEESFLKALFRLLKQRNARPNQASDQAKNLDELIRLFIKNAPKNVEISDDEIVAELMAERYGEATQNALAHANRN